MSLIVCPAESAYGPDRCTLAVYFDYKPNNELPRKQKGPAEHRKLKNTILKVNLCSVAACPTRLNRDLEVNPWPKLFTLIASLVVGKDIKLCYIVVYLKAQASVDISGKRGIGTEDG